VQKFFPYCIIRVYFMSNFFCVIFTIFWKKYLSVVSPFCFCVVLLLLHLSVWFVRFLFFMTYSTSYCYHYKHMKPWHVCMYVCITGGYLNTEWYCCNSLQHMLLWTLYEQSSSKSSTSILSLFWPNSNAANPLTEYQILYLYRWVRKQILLPT
jgi:hypothetical protein